ncbi:cytochrome c [Microvirga sp. 2MCAF38]|uniref:c-type cytochrome n=1 Tax=Microvirga sp. 2MCAF38 TaxID=3232989 RepID=UPI003F95F01B
MRKALAALLVLAVLGVVGFFLLTAPAAWAFLRGDSGMSEIVPAAGHAINLENGRTLFYAGGCSSCHAVPDQDDKTRLGGGLALKSPFGTFHVPNISPDRNDGIGSWSTADFIRAMREGVSPDGRHYYPAFPYASYQRMSVGDLADLFGFLQTLPAVQGRAPDHELPFPFNIRRGLGLWKLAFLDGRPFMPDAAKSPAWNRGAYLINGPGHCAECHSERNFVGAIVEDRRFAGGPDPEGGRGTVPNITPDPKGIGGWTKDELTTLFKTGETPSFDTVGGAMAPVVRNTAHLSDADREAMAEYLLTLVPRASVKRP